MLTLAVACIIVSAIVGMVTYMTRTVKPSRVKFTAGVWKLVNVSFEADAGSQPPEHPSGEDGEETNESLPRAG